MSSKVIVQLGKNRERFEQVELSIEDNTLQLYLRMVGGSNSGITFVNLTPAQVKIVASPLDSMSDS